jgi:hypothetical protein
MEGLPCISKESRQAGRRPQYAGIDPDFAQLPGDRGCHAWKAVAEHNLDLAQNWSIG